MILDNNDLMTLSNQSCDLYRWFAQHWLDHDDATLLTESTLANFYFWLSANRRTDDSLWSIAQHHLDLHTEGAIQFPERYDVVNDRMAD